MTLKSNMATALDVIWGTDYFGETVTYDGESITAIVDYGQELDDGPASAMAKCEIEVKVADVASPAHRDPVVIGSDTWRVEHVIESDWYSHRLALERDERPTFRR